MLTVTEAADKLRISKYTAYRMIQNGTLPAIRGRGRNRLLIEPDAVDALLEPVNTAQPPADSPKLYTVAEAAAIMRCGAETVRRIVKAGQLPATRNPGSNSHLRISADALDAYLASQRVPTAS